MNNILSKKNIIKTLNKPQSRFISVMLVITAFIMMVMAESSYILSSRILKKSADDNYILLTEQKSTFVTDWYLRQKDVVEHVAHAIKHTGVDKQYLTEYLTSYVENKIDSNVYDLYFTDLNNVMISGTGYDNVKEEY